MLLALGDICRQNICSLRREPSAPSFESFTQPRLSTVMAAYNSRSPGDKNRSLSSDVSAQLLLALMKRWTDPEAFDSALSTALSAAADEARGRGLLPEELLLALKAIEQEVAKSLDVADTQDRDRFRIWLVGACMRAFFAVDRQPNL